MRLVVALGGNAIQVRGDAGTIGQQRAAIRGACEPLAGFVAAGHELIVTHGNGPQVGRLLLQDEAMAAEIPRHPLDVHVAETQGQLGYLIQQEMRGALGRARIDRPVVTIVTQVVVDADDPAFTLPSKPIGPFLSSKGAAEYRARGVPIAEVPGGGWRRVVPSPQPRAVVEISSVQALLNAGVIVIACGGGGVPVVAEGNGFRGIAAVIDKDLTAAVLARSVSADVLLILTDVDGVVKGFGTDQPERLAKLTVDDARAGAASGEFPRGSMAEKVLAAALVAETGKRAVIASLDHAREALEGQSGTEVVP